MCPQIPQSFLRHMLLSTMKTLRVLGHQLRCTAVLTRFKHTMVPKHRILNEEEKQKIIAKYNILDDNIPPISRFDPVAQVIGLRPRQYCEIVRPSKTSITSLFYRICSN